MPAARSRIFDAVETLTPLQSLLHRRWRPQWICHSCQQQSLLGRRRLATQTTASPVAGKKPYYITTPIFYVNADPHVGHMYTMILTDVLKRWQVLKGRKAVLCTGTDEHGMKVQQAAQANGVEPKLFCDRGAETFGSLASRINISNDIFMRTSDKRHKEAVEYAWQMLQDLGYIYESRHTGWYSISDETYYPPHQVHLIVDPRSGRKIMVSKETGKEVEWTEEPNYHFRLSAFRERLLDFYAENPNFVVPQKRMEDVVQEVTSGLEDLSISRPVDRLTWGVRVPTDPTQTVYVWLDALLNYASAVGYPFAPGAESAGGWPADVHVVGKDIVRFHCIYWPAFLMALGLPLPKQVLTHGHWTLGRQKMAKSTGNVVNPFFALDRFGVDVMRWYLVLEGRLSGDADYENKYIADKYQKGLRGGLGGLASRVLRGKRWRVSKTVAKYARPTDTTSTSSPQLLHEHLDPAGLEFYSALQALPEVADKHMNDLYAYRALQSLMDILYAANAYISEVKPWELVFALDYASPRYANTVPRDDTAQRPEANLIEIQNRIASCIYLNAETLRMVGIMLQPFIPTSANRLLDMLGVASEKRSWEFCSIGADDTYGDSFVELGKGQEGSLFPALTC